MNTRLPLSTPLPWLTYVFGKITRGRPGRKSRLLKLHRTLRVTREGKIYLGLLMVIGVAAINTGNNLLYLVVATLLSLIIISGVLSESALAKVDVTRVLPRHFYKGTSTAVRFRVTNAKRFFPSFSLMIREHKATDLDSDPVYLIKIPHSETQVRRTSYTFTRRGRHRLHGFNITTSFPFGIFIKGKKAEVEEEVLVYPRPRLSKRPPLVQAPAQGGSYLNAGKKGHGSEIHGLREYTLGDDARFIHWRSAARGSQILVKEFEKETERSVTIVFENRPGPTEEFFEETVDSAAGLAEHYVKTGFSVGLKTLDQEILPARGTRHLYAIMKALALVEPKGTGAPVVRIIAR